MGIFNGFNNQLISTPLGFYLKDITKFEFTKLGKYKQAGYRGEIGNGFITRGGFVHVFAKGNKFQLPRHQNLFQ